MIVFFLLIQLALAFTKPCIIFYTGGSNLMSTTIYNDFLSELNHIDVYKIPFQCNKQSDKFIKMLRKEYSSVNLLGHSSGCVRLLNNCNNNINIPSSYNIYSTSTVYTGTLSRSIKIAIKNYDQ